MAAEVGQPFSAWSYSDLPYNDHCAQADDSVEQMVLDHGSVSFGRFATESLSWENRSVFAHNRRQEELSKLTLPGLVAQKKAFFEEYYKRARRLKAQEAMHQTEAASEEKSDDNALEHSTQENKLCAVMSDDPVANAPSSSFEPSTGVGSLDEEKCQEPHGLGYLTFNPLFSEITGLQNVQQEGGSNTDQKQKVDVGLPFATQTSSRNGINHESRERRVLAPKHVVSTDNNKNNVPVSRIVLPIASMHSGLKGDLEKQEPRKKVVVVSRSTKGSKDPSISLIHIPRVQLKRNSENRNSQDLKDPFHKRVEMKLRALSDRMNADRIAASSRSASYQHADRHLPSCRSSYQNADRVASSSKSALYQSGDRVFPSSKSSAQASHKALHEVRSTAKLPREIFFNKGSHVSHGPFINSSTTRKLVSKSSVMPNSSQINAKTLWAAQVTSTRGADRISPNNGLHNKRKQLSTPVSSDENNWSRGHARASAPTSASLDSHLLYKTAKTPKVSNAKNKVKTEAVQKSSHGYCPVGERNVSLKQQTINCNEQHKKVIPSNAGSRSSSLGNNNQGCGLSLSKSKPRQERPRWR